MNGGGGGASGEQRNLLGGQIVLAVPVAFSS